MSSFFLAFLAVVVCSLGARDQVLLARLSAAGRSGAMLLAIAVPVALATAAAMAWFGHLLAAMLPGAAKTMLVAIALLLAAFELAWPNRDPGPREPTRSLFALAFVLAARQFGDASRFLIFAFAAATGTAWLAGVGGAMGGIVAVVLGVVLGEELVARWPLRAIRAALAAIVGLAAIVLGLSARGLL